MVVHPAPGSAHGTLVNALLFHCKGTLPGINGVKRPGIVHRLDKDTSGVMVAAKTERAMAHLAAQFADHGRTGPLHRAYTAFAWGQTEQGRGTVDAPLGRDQNNRQKQTVRKDGREAITHYAVEARYGGDGWDITRLRCELETAAPIKSACIWPISATRWSPTRCTHRATPPSRGGCRNRSKPSSMASAARPCTLQSWASSTR